MYQAASLTTQSSYTQEILRSMAHKIILLKQSLWETNLNTDGVIQ